jgi:DNA repair photolyase
MHWRKLKMEGYKKTNFKFGITERGDAGLDLSWVDRIDSVECAIIISKCANDNLKNALLKFKDKIIYHATCTGLGGTSFEPNVPSINDKFTHIRELIWNGFPVEQIVIRIDPLFHLYWEEKLNRVLNINYLNNIKEILQRTESLGIKRVRYSFLDYHPHILKRLKKLNSELIFDKSWNLDYNNEINLEQLNRNLQYEACCESCVPIWQNVGCISNVDLNILKRNDLRFSGNSLQHYNCKCPGNRLELLNNKYRCQNGCVYCYWKDKNEQ